MTENRCRSEAKQSWMNRARNFARYSIRWNSSRFSHRVLSVGKATAVDPAKPDEAAQVDFGTNTITSSHYTWYNFVVKNILEQFRRVANFYFLMMVIVQFVIESPLSPAASVLPLIFVILVTMTKQGYEDIRRHNSDAKINRKWVTIIEDWKKETQIYSEKIEVGDIVKVEEGEAFPCDLVLLSSSNKGGKCSVKTANLDGETNLKERHALKQTRDLKPKDKEPDPNSWSSLEKLKNLGVQIRCKKPSTNLNEFDGRVSFPIKDSAPITAPLGLENLLMRGTLLKNTEWVYGCAVYTGADTKLSMNSKKKANKFSKVEKTLNKYLIIFMLLLVSEVTIASSMKYTFGVDTPGNRLPWYLGNSIKVTAGQLAQDIFSFLVLFNYIIPISLYVTLECQKFVGAMFFTWDKNMLNQETQELALCNSSDLNEELGQVEILFSDKTGTLTQNIMVFKKASIGGVKYIKDKNPAVNSQHLYELVLENEEEEIADNNQKNVQQFLEVLSLCHTVQISDPRECQTQDTDSEVSDNALTQKVKDKISENKGEKVSEEVQRENEMCYTASSPDEKALVEACELLGLTFIKVENAQHQEDDGESNDNMTIKDSRGTKVVERVFIRLNVLEFDSTRKRMSVIVRDDEKRLWLMAKGADTSIIPHCKGREPMTSATEDHINAYSEVGLRTLAVAVKELVEADYKTFLKELKNAKEAMVDREKKVTKVFENMENDLTLLGATAVEDKLMDNVEETLDRLRRAGISVWVLTGDKKETARNISISCNHLVVPGMTLLDVTKETAGNTDKDVGAKLQEVVEKVKVQADIKTEESYALLVDGQTLIHILPKEGQKDEIKDKNKQLLFEIGSKCDAVICCRMSPLQKSEIVKMIKDSPDQPTTAAVGDGGNDVAMIQEAHVGLGIVGKEGKAATRAGDFAFSQFMHLQRAFLVHGHWYYYRVAILVQYFFYKNVACFTGNLWYAIYNNFSTQTVYGSINLTLFNLMYTSVPIFVFGLMEQNIPEEKLLKLPQLYKLIQKNKMLSWLELFLWSLHGVWHSVIAFFGWWFFWSYQEYGSLTLNITNSEVLGRWCFGFITYTSVVIVVNIKLLILSSSWNVPFLASIAASIGLHIFISLIYHIAIAEDEYKVIYHTAFSLPIWLYLLLVVVVCLVPDIAISAVRKHLDDKTTKARTSQEEIEPE